MKITKEMLKTNKPTDEFILALNSDSIYCQSNLNIPKWIVVPLPYYLRGFNDGEFEGWIELPRKDQMNKDLPEEKYQDGCVNCVLAFSKKIFYPPILISNWRVANVSYYLKNPNEFEGWIGLEFLVPILSTFKIIK